MKGTICINLCDILHLVSADGIEVENFLDETLQQVVKEKGSTTLKNDWERIYIGSYFCGSYFIHLPKQQLREIARVCRELKKKITLVVPIFSQKHLLKGKQQLNDIINEYKDVIDEITVNDYGMLATVSRTYDKNINFGRLLMKDYRDPRYEDYFMQTLHPKIVAPFFMDLLIRHKITGLEFDKTHAKVDLSAIPKGLQVGVHDPYCYITVGQICEYASIPLQSNKKFRPNEDCSMECMDHRITFQLDKNRDYFHAGRAVYFENKEGEMLGVNTYRTIYFPLKIEGVGMFS